jgi:hypothetical protein
MLVLKGARDTPSENPISKSLNQQPNSTSTSTIAGKRYRMSLHGKREDPSVADRIGDDGIGNDLGFPTILNRVHSLPLENFRLYV